MLQVSDDTCVSTQGDAGPVGHHWRAYPSVLWPWKCWGSYQGPWPGTPGCGASLILLSFTGWHFFFLFHSNTELILLKHLMIWYTVTLHKREKCTYPCLWCFYSQSSTDTSTYLFPFRFLSNHLNLWWGSSWWLVCWKVCSPFCSLEEAVFSDCGTAVAAAARCLIIWFNFH